MANEPNDLNNAGNDRPNGNGEVKRHFGTNGNSGPSQPDETVPLDSGAEDPTMFLDEESGAFDTVRQPAPVATATGTAPRVRYSDLIVAHNDRGSQVTEDYRAVRTSLLAASPQGRFCYFVTSAEAGEGKTLTALNLGMVLTERSDRVTVVVDCNFRNGRMSEMLRAPDAPGFGELLRGEVGLNEVVQPTAYPNLFYIPTGRVRRSDEQASQLFAPALRNVVDDLRRQFDHVLFDTPAVHTSPDASIIGAAGVDGLMVVKMSKTRRESVAKAIRILRGSNVRVAGVVLNERKFFIPNAVYHNL